MFNPSVVETHEGSNAECFTDDVEDNTRHQLTVHIRNLPEARLANDIDCRHLVTLLVKPLHVNTALNDSYLQGDLWDTIVADMEFLRNDLLGKGNQNVAIANLPQGQQQQEIEIGVIQGEMVVMQGQIRVLQGQVQQQQHNNDEGQVEDQGQVENGGGATIVSLDGS